MGMPRMMRVVLAALAVALFLGASPSPEKMQVASVVAQATPNGGVWIVRADGALRFCQSWEGTNIRCTAWAAP